MPNQKIENLLNLALESTEAEREKSLELDVGYDPLERMWEVIVKYSGNLRENLDTDIQVAELLNEYAILRLRESQLEALATLPQIEYIEKPKAVFFQVRNGRRVSCINEVQDSGLSLFGRGVLIAVIDSGIDYTNPDFRREDGTTRIKWLWDQSREGNPPEGYFLGTEYSEAEINAALAAESSAEQQNLVPERDLSGHGTAVAGIAAGNGRNSGGLYRGVAPESELIIVKMAVSLQDGFPRTTELMQGVDYAVRKALELGMPLAVNISFGNTYGAHNSTSLLERFLDDISNYWKNVICIGSGNEGAAPGHTSIQLNQAEDTVIPFSVQESQTAFSIQIWKAYTDVADILIRTPAGVELGPIQEISGAQRIRSFGTEILLYYGEPGPYSTSQEIYLSFLPVESYVGAGIWEIILRPQKVVTGEVHLWFPSSNVLNPGTGFLYPTPDLTLTIPSTAARAITVGAYDALTLQYGDFSGRGYQMGASAVGGISPTEGTGLSGAAALGGVNPGRKPDLVAPGVRVTAPSAGGSGGYDQFTGTSFAAPFVTGAAALLMEWGIVNGNDPFLYGEKVKAYLQRGARPLPGFSVYPNNQVGYGALCVRDSLPNFQ